MAANAEQILTDGAGPSDICSEFHVLGKNWLLVEADRCPADTDAANGTSPAGHLQVEGRDYVIVEDEVLFGRSEHGQGLPGRIADEVLAILTPRELQVCELIAAGRCDKQIARALGISGYTVREYIRRIFAKLQISNRTAVLPKMLGILDG